MAQLRIVRKPLTGTRLPTGYLALHGVLELKVRNRWHRFESLDFMVDSAAGITSIPLPAAEKLHLTLPSKWIGLKVNTAAGQATQQVGAGQITFRVPDLPGRDFIWPCHFVVDPKCELKPLLGLSGVIDDLLISFDATYALEAPHGWLVLEERHTRARP